MVRENNYGTLAIPKLYKLSNLNEKFLLGILSLSLSLFVCVHIYIYMQNFIRAWNAACQSGGEAKLLIPAGNFAAGEIIFQGPCTGHITLEIQGTLLAREDLSLYSSNAWITINSVDGILVTGGGIINGQGQSAWQFHSSAEGSGDLLPVSLIFQKVKNAVVDGLKFVDSKGVHLKITDSSDVKLTNLKINAPGDSPNTDGIHISDSQTLNITDSVIGTGDDCVSVGDGITGATIANIFCGPGHGISIGSLGKRPNEADVMGVTVRNCTFKGTSYGARIKTYSSSLQLRASGIIYENITVDSVANPIIIDQHYNSKKSSSQSKVKISDVHFRNIKGTTSSPTAVTLDCSSAVPCEDIKLTDINLTPVGGVSSLSSKCSNVQPTITGTMNPRGCR